MSVTVDVNVLLHAVNEDAHEHRAAAGLMQRLGDGPGVVYLFWPAIMGFLRISTSSRILPKPLTVAAASAAVDSLLDLAHVRTGSERRDFWSTYRQTSGSDARGNLVPDAHLVALMHQYAVRAIYTTDRGFRRFDGVEVLGLDSSAR